MVVFSYQKVSRKEKEFIIFGCVNLLRKSNLIKIS